MNGCKESIALINAMLEKSLRRNTTVSMFTLDRIYSDLLGIGSTMVWIHSIYTGLVGNKNSMILYCITFISRPIWYQIADLIHTGSTRSQVNTRLVCTNFIPVPNRSVTLSTLPEFQIYPGGNLIKNVIPEKISQVVAYS